MPIDWLQPRSEFPALAHWTHLNTATFGQTPKRAVEAMVRHMTRRDEFACMDFLAWFDDIDQIRAACARLVNCDASDIAFVQNSSAGMALLMHGLNWQSGDEVITLEDEFPNQLYAAAGLDRYGVRLRTAPWPRFYESVNGRTRLVALSTVNYATGFRPPLEEVSEFLASRGVLFYVDGTQSVGALDFDIALVRPTMLCVNAYKWLMTPNGVGFLYVAPEMRKRLPPTVIGWRSDRGWRDVEHLRGAPRFAESAERYEGGMPPFPSIYAMGAVIDMLLELGLRNVEARVLELAGKTRAMLRELGAQVNADNSQIVTAVVPGCDSGKVAAALKEKRIVTSARQGRLRISPHLYNIEDDIDVLRFGLVQLREQMRGMSVSGPVPRQNSIPAKSSQLR
jgi:cysteine desulfurase/selenocysteine lyase